jgi:hypothetical protein
MSRRSTPFSAILIPEKKNPSENESGALKQNEPGLMPPTSTWWTVASVQQNSLPS